jgi:hypothetical protein
MAPKSIKRVVKKYLKKISGNRNDCVACESYLQPVIPPAPLTGDVGRDCGDASRALLLFQAFQSVDQRHAFGVFAEARGSDIIQMVVRSLDHLQCRPAPRRQPA